MAAGTITPIGTYADLDIRNKKRYDILCYKVEYDGSGDPTTLQAALAAHRSGIIGISYSFPMSHVLTVTLNGVNISYDYQANQAPFFRQGKPLWTTVENEALIIQPTFTGAAQTVLFQVVQWPTNRIIPSFGG